MHAPTHIGFRSTIAGHDPLQTDGLGGIDRQPNIGSPVKTRFEEDGGLHGAKWGCKSFAPSIEIVAYGRVDDGIDACQEVGVSEDERSHTGTGVELPEINVPDDVEET